MGHNRKNRKALRQKKRNQSHETGHEKSWGGENLSQKFNSPVDMHFAQQNERDFIQIMLSGDLKETNWMLQQEMVDPSMPFTAEEIGFIPVIEAAASNDKLMLKNLIRAGADINQPDGLGRTALDIAVAENADKVVDYILKQDGKSGAELGEKQIDLSDTDNLTLKDLQNCDYLGRSGYMLLAISEKGFDQVIEIAGRDKENKLMAEDVMHSDAQALSLATVLSQQGEIDKLFDPAFDWASRRHHMDKMIENMAKMDRDLMNIDAVYEVTNRENIKQKTSKKITLRRREK